MPSNRLHSISITIDNLEKLFLMVDRMNAFGVKPCSIYDGGIAMLLRDGLLRI